MHRLFLENIGLKITAVVMAVILWFFVTSKGQSEMTLDAAIELKNIPAGIESVNQSATSVSIRVRGQERLLKSVKPSDIHVYVDLSKARKGRGTYYISKDDVKAPSAMTVLNITPSSVSIILEETVKKTVPVHPDINGTPRKGFLVRSIEIKPSEVVIEGAKTEINRVNFLKTEPIYISETDETFTQNVRFNLAGKNIRTSPQEARVKIVIKK